MVDVNDKAALSSAQFDFAGNEGELSPFAYVPTSTNNRCGVSYSGGQARIEVLGCGKPILLTFITGFVANIEADADIDVTSYPVLDSTVSTLPANTAILSALQTLGSSSEYIYQSSATDTVVGPTVIFTSAEITAKLVKRSQLSLVFIGVKSLTTANAATYPTGAPESFIVAVGGAGYSLGTGIDGTTAETLIDAIRTGNLNFQNYNKATTTNMGHSFCGFTGIAKMAKIRLN